MNAIAEDKPEDLPLHRSLELMSIGDTGLLVVDMQGKLPNYGGERRLNDIPHVLYTATELDDVLDLMGYLRLECEVGMKAGLISRYPRAWFSWRGSLRSVGRASRRITRASSKRCRR